MLPVVVTAAARAEILDARAWYEARQDRLAEQFDTDLKIVIARIGENPRQFPVIRAKARRAIFRHFSYGIFFRILPDCIQVVACLHTSRDPKRW